jgi:hypothetical protein
MSKAATTLWQCLEKFPPVQVRLLAKRPGCGPARDLGLTDSDIAITSGLPLSRVREINRMFDWLDVSVREIMAYTLACGFDPANPKHRQRVLQYQYLAKKRGSPVCQWILKSPRYESEFLPLLLLVKSRQRAISESSTSAAAK